MNLHANAAFSWTGRRRLCELVVDPWLDGRGGGRVGWCQCALRAEMDWPLSA